jgi:hypothetical protein
MLMRKRDNEIQRDANVTKCGWRVGEWSRAVGCSRSYVYLLIGSGVLDTCKVGAMRIIRTAPSDFLARAEAA